MNKQLFLNYPVQIILALLAFMFSCGEDKDNIPVLTTMDVTNITSHSDVTGGNIISDGGSTVKNRGVCWSTGLTPAISDNKTTDGTGAGSFVSSITGLNPTTTYYIRAYATNSYGTGYGSAFSFATKEDTFTDLRDGNVYKFAEREDQVWMAENLRFQFVV